MSDNCVNLVYLVYNFNLCLNIDNYTVTATTTQRNTVLYSDLKTTFLLMLSKSDLKLMLRPRIEPSGDVHRVANPAKYPRLRGRTLLCNILLISYSIDSINNLIRNPDSKLHILTPNYSIFCLSYFSPVYVPCFKIFVYELYNLTLNIGNEDFLCMADHIMSQLLIHLPSYTY